jgi:hypothetical protein
MRTVLNPQLTLSETDIGAIRINLKSRDDIPKLLLGLHYGDHAVAPLRRSSAGSHMPITAWLQYAGR